MRDLGQTLSDPGSPQQLLPFYNSGKKNGILLKIVSWRAGGGISRWNGPGDTKHVNCDPRTCFGSDLKWFQCSVSTLSDSFWESTYISICYSRPTLQSSLRVKFPISKSLSGSRLLPLLLETRPTLLSLEHKTEESLTQKIITQTEKHNRQECVSSGLDLTDRPL